MPLGAARAAKHLCEPLDDKTCLLKLMPVDAQIRLQSENEAAAEREEKNRREKNFHRFICVLVHQFT